MRWLVALLMLSACARSLPAPRTSNEWDERFRACRDGDQRGCYWRARSELGAGNTAQGVAMMKGACEAGVGLACNHVGFYFSEGTHGFQRDEVQARAMWARSCELGSKEGCDSWGTGLRDGVGGPADAAGAVAAYERSCKLEDGAGCTNLAYALLHGAGVKRDLARAQQLWRTVCERDQDQQHSCRMLGAALALGDGLDVDVNEGLRLLRRACNLGDAEDCLEAGTVMESVGSEQEAVRYLRTSCTWGYGRGCRALSRRLLAAPADEERKEEALEVLGRACERKDEESCKQLKELAPSPPAG